MLLMSMTAHGGLKVKIVGQCHRSVSNFCQGEIARFRADLPFVRCLRGLHVRKASVYLSGNAVGLTWIEGRISNVRHIRFFCKLSFEWCNFCKLNLI